MKKLILVTKLLKSVYRTEQGSKMTTRPASSGQVWDVKLVGMLERAMVSAFAASEICKPQDVFHNSTLAVGQSGFPRPYQSK